MATREEAIAVNADTWRTWVERHDGSIDAALGSLLGLVKQTWEGSTAGLLAAFFAGAENGKGEG